MQGFLNVRTIIIGNDREFFSPVDKYVPLHLAQEYIESDIDEADMDVMWEGDNKVAIMPRPLDPAYLQEVSAFFGYQNFHVLSPKETPAGLCPDIMADDLVMDTLVATIRANPGVQIIPFGNSTQFYDLIHVLRNLSLDFATPETPADNSAWTVTYLDTKVGCRELLLKAAQSNPLIHIPEGFVVPDVDTAQQLARYFASQGVVFKANQGGSGIGVNVFPPHKVATEADLSTVLDQISSNPLYAGSEPFIVERYVQPDFSHHGVFPSVDARIFPDGRVVIEAIDAMVIEHDQNEVGFYGCVAGKGLFTQSQSQILRDMTLTIGEALRLFGYVGWFDTDYILSVDGSFTATEANLRSTSMRYMIELGKVIFGPDFERVGAMRSNDKYIRKNLFGITYPELKAILASLMYPISSEKRGIILSESMRSKFNRGKFGYFIAGSDQDDTKAIQDQMENILSKI